MHDAARRVADAARRVADADGLLDRHRAVLHERRLQDLRAAEVVEEGLGAPGR